MDVERAAAFAAGHPRIDAFVARHVREGHWPGAVYAVGPPGPRPRFLGAVGYRCLEPEEERTEPGDLYDLASLTKGLYTAVVALRLAAEGRLDLDRPLLDLLPELSGYAGRTPTLDSLLTHTSGLPAWAPLYRQPREAGDVATALGELPADRPAGVRPVYSCPSAIAAGIVLERAMGCGAEELLRSEVTGPLGIDAGQLSFGPVGAPAVAATERGRRREEQLAGKGRLGREIVPGPDRVLRGEVHDGNARFLGGAAGNAGLFGTASAAFAVISAAVGDEGFLAADLRARLAGPRARSAEEVRTFGFQHGDAPGAPVPRDDPEADGAFGHTGFTGTSAWVFPRADAVAVLLTNRVHPRWTEAPVQEWRREFHALALQALREERT
jgi:CubicO group peptidase (beta-lactamase class C family)